MLISTVPPILKLLAFVHFISIKYENLFGKEYQSYESLREMDKKDQEWPKASNPALETSWIKTEKKKKGSFVPMRSILLVTVNNQTSVLWIPHPGGYSETGFHQFFLLH